METHKRYTMRSINPFHPKRADFFLKDGSVPGLSCSGGGLLEGHQDVLHDMYPDRTMGTAFAYLFRRFGAPTNACCPAKDLCCYWLTTPDPEVKIWLTCPDSHLYGVGYFVSMQRAASLIKYHNRIIKNAKNKGEKIPRLEMQYVLDNLPEENPFHKTYSAMLAAFRELGRPTYIRDYFFNINGEVRDYPKNTVKPFHTRKERR